MMDKGRWCVSRLNVGRDRQLPFRNWRLAYQKRDSELLQMLHQAATLDLNDVILVVGDRDGEILKVVWVEYSDQLLNSFRKCAKVGCVSFSSESSPTSFLAATAAVVASAAIGPKASPCETAGGPRERRALFAGGGGAAVSCSTFAGLADGEDDGRTFAGDAKLLARDAPHTDHAEDDGAGAPVLTGCACK